MTQMFKVRLSVGITTTIGGKTKATGYSILKDFELPFAPFVGLELWFKSGDDKRYFNVARVSFDTHDCFFVCFSKLVYGGPFAAEEAANLHLFGFQGNLRALIGK